MIQIGQEIKQAHEVTNAHALAAAYEMRHHQDLSDQQKAYLMGMRCALAWVLSLPTGGRKLSDMMAGIPLNGTLPTMPVDEWLRKQKEVQQGG